MQSTTKNRGPAVLKVEWKWLNHRHHMCTIVFKKRRTCWIQKDANNKQWNKSDKCKETKDTHVGHTTQKIYEKNETSDNWKELALCAINTMTKCCHKRSRALWQVVEGGDIVNRWSWTTYVVHLRSYYGATWLNLDCRSHIIRTIHSSI
jgi:hypothetical protein